MKKLKVIILIANLFLICIFASFNAKAETILLSKNFQLEATTQTYILKLDNKMKIKFNINVQTGVLYEYYEKPNVNFKLYDYGNDDVVPIINADFWNENNEETIVLDKGTYLIEMSNNDSSIKIFLNVIDVSKYTKKIKLNKKNLTLYTKTNYQLKVFPKYKNHAVKELKWKSSNKNIATVNKNGKIKTKKPGKCTIYVKAKGGKWVKCKLTVKQRSDIEITKFYFEKNFLNGIEPRIHIRNNTKKTIKYVYLDIYFYNRVGDYAYCTLQDIYHDTLKLTGPIKKNKTRKYVNASAMIYNGTTKIIKINSIKIEFMDGTTKTYNISKKGYKEQ